MNYPGWCADVCCDFNTEEQCYDPPSCALVGIHYAFVARCVLVNLISPHLLHSIWYVPRRFHLEAALARKVRRNAVQVSLLVTVMKRKNLARPKPVFIALRPRV